MVLSSSHIQGAWWVQAGWQSHFCSPFPDYDHAEHRKVDKIAKNEPLELFRGKPNTVEWFSLIVVLFYETVSLDFQDGSAEFKAGKTALFPARPHISCGYPRVILPDNQHRPRVFKLKKNDNNVEYCFNFRDISTGSC